MADRPRTRRPAAFAPTDAPRPVCAACWSRPALGVPVRKRGWRVQAGRAVTQAPAEDLFADPAPADEVATATAVYPCANPDCDGAIVVRSVMGGSYLPADVLAHRLAGADGATFLRGRHDRAGIWRDAAGDPRTAPEQRDLFG